MSELVHSLQFSQFQTNLLFQPVIILFQSYMFFTFQGLFLFFLSFHQLFFLLTLILLQCLVFPILPSKTSCAYEISYPGFNHTKIHSQGHKVNKAEVISTPKRAHIQTMKAILCLSQK